MAYANCSASNSLIGVQQSLAAACVINGSDYSGSYSDLNAIGGACTGYTPTGYAGVNCAARLSGGVWNGCACRLVGDTSCPAAASLTTAINLRCSSASSALWPFSGNSLVNSQQSWFFNDTVGGRLATIAAPFQAGAGSGASLGSQPVPFTSIDQAVSLPGVYVGSDFSVAMWIMPRTWTTETKPLILRFDNQTYISFRGDFIYADDRLAISLGTSPSAVGGTLLQSSLPSAAWTHVCFTFSQTVSSLGFMVNLYLNGTSVYNQLSSGSGTTCDGVGGCISSQFFSGFNGWLPNGTLVGSSFDGSMANLHFMPFLLSANDVTALYQGGCPLSPSPPPSPPPVSGIGDGQSNACQPLPSFTCCARAVAYANCSASNSLSGVQQSLAAACVINGSDYSGSYPLARATGGACTGYTPVGYASVACDGGTTWNGCACQVQGNTACPGVVVAALQSFNVTTCGNSGPLAPSASSCVNAYAGQSWASSFSTSQIPAGLANSWQTLMIGPGTYSITAAGAAGYNGNYAGSTATCRGAVVSVTFTLTYSRTLFFLVGQSPTSTAGGGGTFVLLDNATTLVVAGGGGSYWSGPAYSGCDASTNSTQGNPSADGAPGGSGGGGGSGWDCSGGAGLSGDGVTLGNNAGTGDNCGGGGVPLSAYHGGIGGSSTNDRPGGFGGGARIGGGGGYSGGGGQAYAAGVSSTLCGGGGGSYCYSGSTSSCAQGYNTGAGYVTITPSSTTLPSPYSLVNLTGLTATQSAPWAEYSSSSNAPFAVDGNTTKYLGAWRANVTPNCDSDNVIAVSLPVNNVAWLMVDLQAVKNVHTVFVYGRNPYTYTNSSCWPDCQSGGLTLAVGNSSTAGGTSNPTCAYQFDATIDGNAVTCNMVGRYVTIYKTIPQAQAPPPYVMSICQVVVQGSV